MQRWLWARKKVGASACSMCWSAVLAVLAAVICLGWSIGMARDQVGGVLRKSLAPIAVLLLTIVAR